MQDLIQNPLLWPIHGDSIPTDLYSLEQGFPEGFWDAHPLKSVRVHFAYGRIALTLELLGRFGRFLDKDDRHNSPVLLVPILRLLGL